MPDDDAGMKRLWAEGLSYAVAPLILAIIALADLWVRIMRSAGI